MTQTLSQTSNKRRDGVGRRGGGENIGHVHIFGQMVLIKRYLTTHPNCNNENEKLLTRCGVHNGVNSPSLI